MTEVKRGLDFFAESLVGEVVDSVKVANDGVEISFRSGIRALAKSISQSDISGEKIVGYHVRPDAQFKIIVLHLYSGGELTLLV